MPNRFTVHTIRIPKAQSGKEVLWTLGIGCFVGYFLAAAINHLVLTMLAGVAGNPKIERSDVSIALAWIGAVWGPVSWAWLIASGEQRLRQDKYRARIRRLDRACEHPRATTRIPHRVFERNILTRGHSRARLFAELLRTPPGRVAVATNPESIQVERPISTDIGFEPIDLLNDPERVSLLATSAIEKIEQKGGKFLKSEIHTRPVRSALGLLFRLAFAVVVLASFGRKIAKGDIEGVIGGLIVLCCILGPLIISALFIDRRCWLVPGGLIFRRNALRGGGVVGGYVTARDSPLYLDDETDTGWVVLDGKVQRFQFIENGWWAVATGWISEARTPDPDEVSAFLGPNARLKTNRISVPSDDGVSASARTEVRGSRRSEQANNADPAGAETSHLSRR